MEALRCDILTGLATDTDAQARLDTLHQTLCPDSKWSLSPTGFLLHEGIVYVPTGGDLRMCVLKACHDHLLAGHPGQMKTLELLRCDYFWPKMREDIIGLPHAIGSGEGVEPGFGWSCHCRLHHGDAMMGSCFTHGWMGVEEFKEVI